MLDLSHLYKNTVGYERWEKMEEGCLIQSQNAHSDQNDAWWNAISFYVPCVYRVLLLGESESICWTKKIQKPLRYADSSDFKRQMDFQWELRWLSSSLWRVLVSIWMMFRGLEVNKTAKATRTVQWVLIWNPVYAVFTLCVKCVCLHTQKYNWTEH